MKDINLYRFNRFMSHISFGRAHERFKNKKDFFNQKLHNISIVDCGKNNKIIVSRNYDGFVGKIFIKVVGDNNIIEIPHLQAIKGIVKINVAANNSVVSMKHVYVGHNLTVVCGTKYKSGLIPDNLKVVFGENVCVEGLDIQLRHNDSGVYVRDDAMVAFGVHIFNTDFHPIYDKNTGKLLNNNVKDIIIGKHVWLGRDVKVLKNVKIADGCIIGTGAIVSKTCDVGNGVYVGNPAVCKKDGVFWGKEDDKFIFKQ